MRAQLKFSTEAELTRLKAIDNKDTIYVDSKTPGLRVRVSARSGRKAFILEYRPPGQRNATKRVLDGVETLKDARAKAIEIKVDLQKGADPLQPPPPKITLRFIAEQYQLIKQPRYETWRCIEKRILPKFGNRIAASIRAFEISAWHAGITKTVYTKDSSGKIIQTEQAPAPHVADRVLDIMKALFNWAERQELMPRHTNPCEFIDRNFSQLDTERNYEWEDAELSRLGSVLRHYQALAQKAQDSGLSMVCQRNSDGSILESMPNIWSVLAIRFLVITGVRKNEALKLRWDQIREDRQVIEWVRNSRRKETKVLARGQRAMLRAITEPLEEILGILKAARVVGNPYVFVGADRSGHLKEITRVWYRIRDEAELRKPNGEKPRIHDLRHFYGQMAAEAGMHEKQIMALMGHSTTLMSARYSKYGREARSVMAETVATRISEKIPL